MLPMSYSLPNVIGSMLNIDYSFDYYMINVTLLCFVYQTTRSSSIMQMNILGRLETLITFKSGNASILLSFDNRSGITSTQID